ncbi:MAG: iron ABC transporter permease [Salinivirgaceae bacterium]|jgi:iron complex transport system permease protein|nr:iron ABC transporter permease [Salinivirgaceae bacterium]
MKGRYIHWFYYILALLIVLLLSIWLSVSYGEINLSLVEIIQILKSKSGIEYTILNKIRIPRILLGFAVGGALSLSGVLLQGVYRNPLVEPYTLGISGGASLGVALAIIFGLSTGIGSVLLPISGFIGAAMTIFLVYFLSLRNNYVNISKMLLIGVMVSFIASSAVMFLMSTTTTENVHSIVFWIMGSLDTSNVLLIRIVLITSLIGLVISYLYVNPLNALRLGEAKAKHLGVNTHVTIRVLFIIASLLTGISVSVVGVIGFVGLIVPHLLRIFIGSDYRILLIASFLGGGIFIILCDLVARTLIAPNELPIGVITGIIGGVIFIIALSKSKIH